MTTEAEYNAQETEREYGRNQTRVVYARLDQANLALHIMASVLRELAHVKHDRDQHSDNYLDDLDDRVTTILQEWEVINGY